MLVEQIDASGLAATQNQILLQYYAGQSVTYTGS